MTTTDTDEPQATAGEQEVGSATTTAGGASRDRWLVPVLSVVALVLIVAAVLAGVGWWNAHQQDQRRATAVETGRQMAVALVSVSADTADADVRRVLDGAIGDFGKIFSENLESYVDIVRKGRVNTTGEVASAGLERIDDAGTARVLVAMKAVVRNEQVPQGENRTYRMAVELQEQADGRWLASKVDFVP